MNPSGKLGSLFHCLHPSVVEEGETPPFGDGGSITLVKNIPRRDGLAGIVMALAGREGGGRRRRPIRSTAHR